MDKIFDEDVETYLREAGVSDKEIAKIKLRSLKKGIELRMKAVSRAILTGDNKRLEEMTFYSPAGDDMGMDNTCIEFGHLVGEEYWDVGSITNYMNGLRRTLDE